jgi:hypothetical protein
MGGSLPTSTQQQTARPYNEIDEPIAKLRSLHLLMNLSKLKFYALLMALIFTLTARATVDAQGSTAVVSLPVSGQMLLEYNNLANILIVDTASGVVQNLVNDGQNVGNAMFSPTGDQITYFSNIGNLPENRRNIILDLATGNRQPVTVLGERDNLVIPERWSVNENAIFYYVPNIVSLPYSHWFELVDLDTGTLTKLREFSDNEVLSGFDLLANAPGLALRDIFQITPNPMYDSWIALALRGINIGLDPDLSGDTSDEANIEDVILWNYQTQEMISVAHALGHEIDLGSFIEWRQDGKALGVKAEDLGLALLRFDPTGNEVILELEKNRLAGSPVAWLGVEDLLINVTRDEARDTIYQLGQIVGDRWYGIEFLRLPYQDFPTESINLSDWRLTADEDERRELSCLFDTGLPAQLTVNERGQVTFTDGTPSRLRSAPGTDSEGITQMPEGTPFTIIGEPYCADEYRWWQIQLDDGTVGYAAETSMIADEGEYFLEPI